jgi:prepilin-type processing-associated H-X9-DG protein
MFGDGEPRLEYGDHFMTVWHDINQPTWNMFQYHFAMSSQFRDNRHKKAINAAFADGHAATFPVRPSSLERILIFRGR